QIWRYDRGPRQFPAVMKIADGVVQSIEFETSPGSPRDCPCSALRVRGAPSARDPDRDPGVRLRIAAPVAPFDRQLVLAGTQRGAVERNAQMTVGVLRQVRDHAHAALIDAIDGHAERAIRRT